MSTIAIVLAILHHAIQTRNNGEMVDVIWHAITFLGCIVCAILSIWF